ncbi:DUF551 domain-containing protein [Enterobacter sp. 198]|uniref:DUF551 domain-containing protein n=1 Tax=Enterobacter sp. 198 TaxID=1640346 RepID=UPI00125E659E|nr:DUF551 domain-containing protein [Enterobacter sp. 198]ELY2041144.1 DUF551 domain-containing protein [Enterobacter ludwigii]KAB5475420.1 DUF551 domain-containing protein [Enterobacter sp. 198]
MSTITKEQAQKIIEAADEVITALAGTNEDVHPEDSRKMCDLWDDLNDRYAPPEVVRELARIALASLEARPAIHRWRRVTVEPYGPYPWHYSNFIGFSKPVEGIEDEYYYSAPPAPVSMKDHQIRDLVNELRDIAVEYYGTQQLRERIAKTVRAAMLQGADGNAPVIPDGWVACSERMPEKFKAILAFNEYGEVWSGAYDRYWNFYCDNLLVEHVTHWMPLPVAPQQEVK